MPALVWAIVSAWPPAATKGAININVGVKADGTLRRYQDWLQQRNGRLGRAHCGPDFYEQYAGQAPPINLGEQVQAITGATISSRAVTNGVNLAFEAVQPML